MPDVLEHRAVRRVPVVDRRDADRLEEVAEVAPGEHAVGDRGVRRAEGGGAGLGDAAAGGAGKDRERVYVRGLALVGRHAGGGVALEMLDRGEAFLRRKVHVARDDVALVVDEGLRRVDFP